MVATDLSFAMPNVRMPTWIVRFDKAGLLTSPETRDALLARLNGPDRPTCIIFMSHGWNTDFSDAEGQYGDFLRAFEKVAREHPPSKSFSPLFVGVTWPSVWFPFDRGPKMAAEGARKSADDGVAALTELLDPTQAGHLRDLMELPRWSGAQASEAAKIALPHVGVPESGERPETAAFHADDLVAGVEELQSLFEPAALERSGTIDFDRLEPTRAAGAPTSLDPINFVRLLSVYGMKDRAARVGASGVSVLLRSLLAAGLPVHLVGHSFGAKVMMSALCADGPPDQMVKSALLLQPAISHLAFASTVPGRSGAGGYVDAFQRVASPIFSTYSRSDFPLHEVFHRVLVRAADLGEPRIAPEEQPPNRFAALGGYGPRNSGEHLEVIREPGRPYEIPAGTKIVGLNGSTPLADESGKAHIDCHGCVANPHTGWALLQQITRA